MSAISSMVSSVSKGLLDQRKPQVLQEYAEKVADALSKSGLASLFKLDEIHQYQGHGTNHCGPTTLAMIINMMLGEEGYDCHRVKYNDLQAAMQAGSLGFGFTGYRLQGAGLLQGLKIVNDITGATLPWGLEHAFADFNAGLMKSGGPNLGNATFAEKGTKEDLLENIKRGYKTAIMVVWPDGGGAHWVAVVDYDAEKDAFTMLDPANEKGGPSTWPWSFLSEHWHRPIGIPNLPDLPFVDEEKLEDLLTLESVIITFKPPKAKK